MNVDSGDCGVGSGEREQGCENSTAAAIVRSMAASGPERGLPSETNSTPMPLLPMLVPLLLVPMLVSMLVPMPMLGPPLLLPMLVPPLLLPMLERLMRW